MTLARSWWSMGLNTGFSKSCLYCLVGQNEKEWLDTVVIVG